MGTICAHDRKDAELCLTQSKIEDEVMKQQIEQEVQKLSSKKAYTKEMKAEIQQILEGFATNMKQDAAKLKQENTQLIEKIQLMNHKPTGSKKLRILSIDGGGMRGLTVAQIFERLDKELPGWSKKVDFVAGTSTGSILASFIARGDSGEQIKELYLKHGSKIFEPYNFLQRSVDLYGLKGSKFNSENIKKVLTDYFGEITLKEMQKKILITSFDLDGNPLVQGKAKSLNSWRGKFFHNFNDEGGDDKLVECLLASTAAPTFFSIHNGFTDGGVIANNPAMCALAQAINVKYGNYDPHDIVMLSVGCGKFNKVMDVTDPHKGILDWAMPLLEVMFEGQGESAHFQCESLLGNRIFRMEPLTSKNLDSFSAEQENLSDLQKVADEYDINPVVQWMKKYWLTD